MADEQIVDTLLKTADGKRVRVGGDSLADATMQTKGAVKKGDGVAKMTEIGAIVGATKINEMISRLRESGCLENNKFVVIYDPNYTEDFDTDWYDSIYDSTIYEAEDTTDVKFYFYTSENIGEYTIPWREGYRFLGWALSPSAATPDYPYDESDPQTYTITFTDNDIILYAVWGAITYTLTYSLGAIGQGDVPSPVTVMEGETVQISTSPAPTDSLQIGEFIGWSMFDLGQYWASAQYHSGYTIELYNDVILYPVFARQYYLRYLLGNDATGTVPSMEQYYNGQPADIDFNPSVTCISDPTKVFIGWSLTDESSTAEFTTSTTTTIYMNSNVTLYPVFASQSSNYVTIVNNHSNGVNVNNNGSSQIHIAAGSQDDFNFIVGAMYEIEGESKSFDATAYFTGDYNGTQYSNVKLNVISKIVHDPSDSSTWEFSDGDNGTITINNYSGS